MNRTENSPKGYQGGMRLAEVYIPIQTYGETFDLKNALMYGTIFPELYRPYRPVHRNPQ